MIPVMWGCNYERGRTLMKRECQVILSWPVDAAVT